MSWLHRTFQPTGPGLYSPFHITSVLCHNDVNYWRRVACLSPEAGDRLGLLVGPSAWDGPGSSAPLRWELPHGPRGPELLQTRRQCKLRLLLKHTHRKTFPRFRRATSQFGAVPVYLHLRVFLKTLDVTYYRHIISFYSRLQTIYLQLTYLIFPLFQLNPSPDLIQM